MVSVLISRFRKVTLLPYVRNLERIMNKMNRRFKRVKRIRTYEECIDVLANHRITDIMMNIIRNPQSN